MHRSGTSALARVVNLLGAAMPNDLMPPAPGNETGHWEPAKVAALHDEILASAGSHWGAPIGPADLWFGSPQASAFVARIKDVILSEYGDAPLFVVKDPRLSLVFPLWSRALSELGVACKAIVAVRNPLESARSLCKREIEAHPHDLWHIDRAGLMFLRYALGAERWTRPHERGFVHYDDLLGDWRGAMRRLSGEINMAWPLWDAPAENEIDRFLSASHRHYRENDDLTSHGAFWAQWIGPVYRALDRACSGAAIDQAHFDQARTAYDAAGGAFAKHFEATAHDLARQIDALKASTSWRITAPARKLAGAVRMLRSPDRRPKAPKVARFPGAVAIGATGAGTPMRVSLGALCCITGIAAAGLFAQGGGFWAPRFAAPQDVAWKTMKIERFGAAMWPPFLARERRRLACLPAWPREVVDGSPDFSPWIWRAPGPFAFDQHEGLCSMRGWRSERLLLRI